jgi:hypothetical protein
MVFKVKRGSLLGLKLEKITYTMIIIIQKIKMTFYFVYAHKKNVKRERTWAGKRRPKPTSRE